LFLVSCRLTAKIAALAVALGLSRIALRGIAVAAAARRPDLNCIADLEFVSLALGGMCRLYELAVTTNLDLV